MKKAPTFESEEAFAEIIVNWLKENGWIVYQEVQARAYSGVADIVAEKDGKYWIIECKLNFGFRVMAQADVWSNCANYISVAVPVSKTSMFRRKICKLLNIGVITLLHNQWSLGSDKRWNVYEYLKAPKQELKHKHLINALTEKHKTYAKAGNSYGKRVTPFNTTVENLTNVVKEEPGILLKQAITTIKHHYATDKSAYTCISGYIKNDIIKGFEIKYDGNKPKIYLKEL